MTFDPWPQAREFFLLRHGEVDWNKAHLCVGQKDRRLTARGRRQAEEARAAVRALSPGAIVHSSLSRAADTARLVAQGLNCNLVSDVSLAEARFGIKEGMPENDPDDDFISSWLEGGHITGAESFVALQARVRDCVSRGMSLAGADPVLFVTHWGVFAAISRLTGNAILDPKHCVIYRAHRAPDTWILQGYSDPAEQ